MSEILINPAKTVSFSGHRILNKDVSEIKLKEQIEGLINQNYDTFLVGMALGFDTLCFHELEKLKEKKNIKIVACVPCPEQADRFSEWQRKEYFRMLDMADKIVVISQKYSSTCMQKRNEFMVDNSSILVCYKRRESGGTANTVNYAKKTNKMIIEL